MAKRHPGTCKTTIKRTTQSFVPIGSDFCAPYLIDSRKTFKATWARSVLHSQIPRASLYTRTAAPELAFIPGPGRAATCATRPRTRLGPLLDDLMGRRTHLGAAEATLREVVLPRTGTRPFRDARDKVPAPRAPTRGHRYVGNATFRSPPVRFREVSIQKGFGQVYPLFLECRDVSGHSRES